MTTTTTKAIMIRGRFLSKALSSRNNSLGKIRQYSTGSRRFLSSSSSSSTRHLSSVLPMVLDEDEGEQQEWPTTTTRTTTTPPAVVALQSPSSSTSILQQKQQSALLEQQQQTTHDDDDNHNNNDTKATHNVDDSSTSPSELVFTGNHQIPITSTLDIVTPDQDTPHGIWPVFRLLDEDGRFRNDTLLGQQEALNVNTSSSSSESTSIGQPTIDGLTDISPSANNIGTDLDALRRRLRQEYPHLDDDMIESCGLLETAKHDYVDVGHANTLLRAYTHMVRLREMDVILQNAQRQGRISFYMTCRGEEAVHIGAASALDRSTDVVLAQYREAGLLMWRGFTLEQFTNQCFANDLDLGKGRQMPVHYGSRALNYHTISSPLGTQLPQAVGVAYHSKVMGNNNSVTACFFGDGCASTTDFHSACNFAATLHVPVLFLCRNNGYAISTSVEEQYAGDGIVSRAPGYGMAGIRVDGNDLFAVHMAVAACKRYAVEHSSPVLIELMTYRQGHHSTSDDSTRYRSLEEVHSHQRHGDPVKRMDAFLQRHDIVDEGWMLSLRDEEKMAVLRAMEEAERRPKPKLDELFQDVYESLPPHLQRQEAELRAHIAKYPERYET